MNDKLIFEYHADTLYEKCISKKKLLKKPENMSHGDYNLEKDIIDNILFFQETFNILISNDSNNKNTENIKTVIFNLGQILIED